MSKKFIYFLIAILLAFVGPVTAQAPEPGGWQTFVKTITETKFNDVASLNGRSFSLTLPSASGNAMLRVTPAQAFEIKSAGGGAFNVKIVDAAALVDHSKPLLKYFPIGWDKADSGIFVSDIAIEGQASCTYAMTFRQTGGGDLNLSAMDSDYVISWDVDHPARLSSIDRAGAGLSIVRKAGETGPVSVRLSVKDKADGKVQSTKFIPIPSCGGGPSTEVVIADPKPEPKVNVPASSCLKHVVNTLTPCYNCGLLSVVRNMTTTNQCARRVHCEGQIHKIVAGGAVIGSQERWVDLYGQQSTTYDVTMQATSAPTSFTVEGPVGGTCNYVD